MSSQITMENYSERSFVVRGETTPYKESMSMLGGKWNSRLRDGPGWIFSMSKKESVEKWLNTTNEEKLTNNNNYKTYREDNNILNEIRKTNNRITKLEKMMQTIISLLEERGSKREEEEEDKVVFKRLLK